MDSMRRRPIEVEEAEADEEEHEKILNSTSMSSLSPPMSPLSPVSSVQSFPPRSVLFTVGGIFVLLTLYVGNFTNQPTIVGGTSTSTSTSTTTSSSTSNTNDTPPPQQQQQLLIEEGVVVIGDSNNVSDSDSKDTNSKADRIAYYHCSTTTVTKSSAIASTTSSTTSSSSNTKDIVLLHGAAFTKEDWKTSGILQDLCHGLPPENDNKDNEDNDKKSRSFTVTVTAVDLPVSANDYQLKQLLQSLHHKYGLISSLPISALVTPSASGKTITDWIRRRRDPSVSSSSSSFPSSSLSDITSYVQRWIPVACGSVNKLSDDEIRSIQSSSSSSSSPSSPNFSILAIYGDLDVNGRVTSNRLHDLLGNNNNNNAVQILELKGRHPVYLDSPKQFVAALLEFVTST